MVSKPWLNNPNTAEFDLQLLQPRPGSPPFSSGSLKKSCFHLLGVQNLVRMHCSFCTLHSMSPSSSYWCRGPRPRLMVTQMGFSDKVGQIAVSQGGGPTFLGQQIGLPTPMSQLTADLVDSEQGCAGVLEPLEYPTGIFFLRLVTWGVGWCVPPPPGRTHQQTKTKQPQCAQGVRRVEPRRSIGDGKFLSLKDRPWVSGTVNG